MHDSIYQGLWIHQTHYRAWRCHQTMAAFGQIAALVPLAICGDFFVETNEEFQLQALEVKLSVSKLTATFSGGKHCFQTLTGMQISLKLYCAPIQSASAGSKAAD